MKMFHYLLCMLVMMSVGSSFALAETTTVDVGFKTTTLTVADVPFPVTVTLNTHDTKALSYNLFVASDNGKAVFLSAGKADLFNGNDVDANSGPQSGGAVYRFQVKPKVGYDGVSKVVTPLFVVTAKISGLEKSSAQLKMNGQAIHTDNVITPSEVGKTIEIVQTPFSITPVLSTCGDGVVGYIDTDKNGIKEVTEAAEACDTLLSGGEGCSVDCKYIKKEYHLVGIETLAKKPSCDFGSYTCGLEKLKPRELFLAKVASLVNGQCFPYTGHQEGLYCSDVLEDGKGQKTGKQESITTADATGKISTKQKFALIEQLAIALRDLLKDIVVS